MKKLLFFSSILIILSAVGISFFWSFLELEKIITIQSKIIEIREKEIFTPAPLKGSEKREDPGVVLTQQEIIKWTNYQREKNGLAFLEENSQLNAMAEKKVEDMFEKQYFAHQSPNKEEVEDLAQEFDYKFLFIGENLAMGNFANDQDLVESWMASPGHKENILNENYQEVGVAVKKGFFEGKSTWLAVQHFGLSSTVCPQPNQKIKLEIEEKEKEIKIFEELLSKLQSEIKRMRPKWGSKYQKKVEEYNSLVEEYNKLLLENKNLINQYNLEVQEFNQCLNKLK